jgi:hypothetical protein
MDERIGMAVHHFLSRPSSPERTIPPVPATITIILKAIAVIVFFAAYHYLLPKVGCWVRDRVRRIFTHLFSPLLSARDQRKAAEAMQEARRRRGMPPLENPFL